MKKFLLALPLLCLLFVPSGQAERSLPDNFFGVMSQETPTLRDTQMMASGGITAYRLPMSWDAVQGSQGQPFRWEGMDAMMRNLVLARIEVLPIMMGTPAGFANDFRVLPIRTASQREGWAAYLREAIRRYGPEGSFWEENPGLPRMPIRTWQIWNEANFVWFTSPVSASAYATLLRQSHQVIRAEDPGANIMLASLFARPEGRQGQDSAVFLRKLYRLGTRPLFDLASLHPYSSNTPEMAGALWRFRNVMKRGGDGTKPLAITEMGWGSGKATAFDKGSLVGQADELRRAYRFLLRKRRALRLQSVFWFSWEDMPRSVPSCNFCYSSGLFFAGDELIAKPAWWALKKITRGA